MVTTIRGDTYFGMGQLHSQQGDEGSKSTASLTNRPDGYGLKLAEEPVDALVPLALFVGGTNNDCIS